MLKPYYEEKNIEIYCGDSLEIMKEIPDKSIDLVLTDPPYNVNFAKWDNIKNYKEFASLLLAEWKRISSRIAFTPGLINVGMWSSIEYPKWILCWYKPAAMKRSPFGFCNWDAVLFYGKSLITHGYTDVIKATIKHEEIDHPSIKPLKLMTGILERTSKKGNTVLDPFLGSGTTLVACKELGRKGIGIEISQKYCDIAIQRLKNTTQPLGI